MTDTLDAIAREMQRTIDQHIFGSNDEVDAYLRGIVRKLYALSNQGEGAFGWYTEDYRTDRSATTYDCIVAERWRMKGWPVWNLYANPKEAEADRRDAEADSMVMAARLHRAADELLNSACVEKDYVRAKELLVLAETCRTAASNIDAAIAATQEQT